MVLYFNGQKNGFLNRERKFDSCQNHFEDEVRGSTLVGLAAEQAQNAVYLANRNAMC